MPCSTAALQAAVKLPDVTVSTAVDETSGSFTPPGTTTAITGLPDFCDVNLIQTDPAGNPINIVVWLPAKWNGNFQGVGGGGFTCGISWSSTVGPSAGGNLTEGVTSGYATASTDCGVPESELLTGNWVLKSNGTLNWPLIQDFASAGIHDMTVVGKAVTAAFYVHAPGYTYFYGCSTGGREGLMEAQKYPADYNGIVSGAPAINWAQIHPGRDLAATGHERVTRLPADMQGRRFHRSGHQGLRHARSPTAGSMIQPPVTGTPTSSSGW